MFANPVSSLQLAAFGYFVFGLVSIYLVTLLWTWADARSRGKSPLIAVAMVAFLVWPFGLIAWLLLRPPTRISALRVALLRPRYGVLACLAFTAILAVFISYFMSHMNYEAIALARIPFTGNQLTYAQHKDVIVQKLLSDALAKQVSQDLQGTDNTITPRELSKLLTVDMPESSEIVRISVQGQGNHAQDRSKRIADCVAATFTKMNPDIDFTVIQNAVIPEVAW